MRRKLHALIFLVTAACSLTLTLAAWHSARSDAESEARSRFDLRAAEIVLALKGRMIDYEQVLLGAVGLFAASERVEREEWNAYVRTVQIERAYPGIQGLGFAPYLRPGPTSDVGRAPVLYLMPLDERNRRALGFDMYSEPARRDAMDRARDSGASALTHALAPVEESGADVQIGILMYLPVYRNGAAAETVVQRRAALAGFVFATFRIRDLIAGIVGIAPGVDIRLADVTDSAGPTELLRTAPGGVGARRTPPLFARTDSFFVGQRSWRLDTESLPSLEAEVASNRPRVVLVGGLAITALLLLVVWSLSTTREHARELAWHMTVAMRASEERLQLALASSHLALFDWEVAAGLVHLSPEWSAMLGGRTEASMVPIQKLQSLVHPEDSAAVQAQVQALLADQIDSYRIEHRVLRVDGSWKWIESSARVNERGAGGRALRVTGANADIDERKAVERLKSEFIATVSHELRTPLTSMLGSLGLLREGSAGELPPEARPFLEIAYSNSERLAELINDILDMERIAAGRMEMQIETVPLDALLRRAVELNAAYGERFEARYRVVGGASGLSVRADPDRLMQVLTNLLSNAAKHSPRGGEVRLEAADAGRLARISVADRGPGIAPEFMPRLFGKFEQADRAHGGTGLGLAISKALIERMDGRIGCDSEAGRGSRFWVELPKG